MLEKYIPKITQELKLQPRRVAATALLLEEGATVPFYRPLPQGTHRRTR